MKHSRETDPARAQRVADERAAFEAQARLDHVAAFLARLAVRARREGDDQAARDADRLATMARERPLDAEDLGWVRGWWEYLAALDRSYFPGLYAAQLRGRGVSPLWRVGSALDVPEAEFRKQGEKVEAFVQANCDASGRTRAGVTVETLVEAML